MKPKLHRWLVTRRYICEDYIYVHAATRRAAIVAGDSEIGGGDRDFETRVTKSFHSTAHRVAEKETP